MNYPLFLSSPSFPFPIDKLQNIVDLAKKITFNRQFLPLVLKFRQKEQIIDP